MNKNLWNTKAKNTFLTWQYSQPCLSNFFTSSYLMQNFLELFKIPQPPWVIETAKSTKFKWLQTSVSKNGKNYTILKVSTQCTAKNATGWLWSESNDTKEFFLLILLFFILSSFHTRLQRIVSKTKDLMWTCTNKTVTVNVKNNEWTMDNKL